MFKKIAGYEVRVNEESKKVEAVLVNGYAKALYKRDSKLHCFTNVLPCSESSFRYYASKENSIVK